MNAMLLIYISFFRLFDLKRRIELGRLNQQEGI